MKRIILPALILITLSGCSSSSGLFSGKFARSVEPFNWSAGEVNGTTKSYYWLTRSATEPQSASDYIELTNDAWYKSSYKWQDGTISEIVREGQATQDDHTLQRYLVHIRFSEKGEAIYQRYRVGDQVLPLNQKSIDAYVNDAKHVASQVEELHSDDQQLIQGVWNGQTFESCDGRQYTNVDFQHSDLPLAVKDRMNGMSSYAAFIGESNVKHSSITVNKLISLADDDHACIQRPHLNMN
ncbi:DUF1481 domain-containing protein [Vibrio sp. S11_S32]|uniref:DUF1481 domain-containing protein n=1 Tax=Vibrio sp. S11_S32 TaxID=2720225 RepID=UPI001680A3FE|nr:DUF1481 domain-containing protein [Vibrio sp. S11_S32]MBD1575823.1 DUF1481 domain-containing protein [Vibrio sp. S11_S32]